MTKLIPLTKGQFAIVDDADYEWLSQWKWYYNKGYAIRKENKKAVHMHRQIMSTPESLVCDHVNGNSIDNQRSNLRNCAAKDNHRNRRQSSGKSQYKGVYFEKKRGSWRADIRVNYKLQFLGYQASEIDAARTYDRAAVLHFGEFANLNFPQEQP